MAAREVLAGAVLALHQEAEATIPNGETLAETMRATVETALRVKDERDTAVKLLRTVLDMRELGAEGPTKTDIRAFLARLGKPGVLTRFDRQRQLERDIVAFNPDTPEALELLHSFSRSLTDRYGDARTTDLNARLREVEEALSELEAW